MARCAAWLVGAIIVAGCAPFERGERRGEPDATVEFDAGPGDGATGPSFEADVLAVLLDRCGDCHREGGTGAASIEFVLTDDPAIDRDTVLALVDTLDPDASGLLEKARGEGHGGGSAMPPDSADYAVVRAWIAAGAPP